MKRFIIALIVILTAASCSRKNIDNDFSAEELFYKLDAKLFTLFDKPVDRIIDERGYPDKIDTNEVTNRHTGYKDNVYTLYYDDIELSIYHAIELNKYLLQSVLFNSDDMLEDFNIDFGMSKEDFEFLSSRKKDEIEKADYTEVIYSTESETGFESLFVFRFKDDSLYRVKYNAPID